MNTPLFSRPIPWRGRKAARGWALRAALVLACGGAHAAEEKSGGTLADLSIEQLMNESVTSVAKKETRLVDAPAAISVLTAEDIRQSGRMTLTELLRLVPGTLVAQNGAHQWAVGVRGFADEFTRNVQVLIDGRTVYSTAVGGVDWEVQDVFLEDIERIEVIRGPGAALWGANAVNGVVNVISKSAKQTQGDLASVVYGRNARPDVTVRHGGQLGANVYYRASVKYLNHASYETPDGASADDAWSAVHAGFRLDAEPTSANSFTLQGDYLGGRFNDVDVSPRLTPPFSALEHDQDKETAANLLGRWTHHFVNASDFTLQAYYDHVREKTDDAERLHHIYDLDAQYHFAPGSRHDVLVGFGYRFLRDKLTPTRERTVTPERRDEDVFNVFVQDSITLVPDRLTLTLGSKFEHTPFTGFEYQPTVRAVWQATKQQTLWAGISRAVRTPTRIEREGRVVTEVEPPGIVHVNLGSRDLRSEELLAHEIGYRVTPDKRVSFDFTAFYNRYRDLVLFAERPVFLFPGGSGRGVALAVAENEGHGENYGAELAARWQAAANWRLTGGYTWLRTHISDDLDPDSPEHQFFLTSHVELTPKWSWDASLNYFSRVPAGEETGATSAYGRWDTGVTWRPSAALELSVFGQNLAARRHNDYDTERLASVPRSVYGKVTWRF